jgi:hypothetical protein
MYLPELDVAKKRLIYAGFAACEYPHGLYYDDTISDGSPSDDECGERWISVPADAVASRDAAGRKKRTRKHAKKESITFVRVQDFFTQTPYVRACGTAISIACCHTHANYMFWLENLEPRPRQKWLSVRSCIGRRSACAPGDAYLICCS